MGDTDGQKNVRSLFDLSMNCVTQNIQTLCTKTSKGFTLHAELALPKLICDKYIEMYQSIGGKIDDSFAHIFENVTKTKLGSVNICNSSISDNGLKFILRHNLNEITLENCTNLTQKTNFNIFKYSVNLRSLAIGSNVQIIPFSEVSNISLSLDDIPERSSGKALNLEHLVLRGIEDIPFAFPYVFSNNSLDKLLLLSVLDLSNCLSVGNLEYLRKFPNLHTLILFNVGQLQDNDALSHICSLRSLVVLDISQSYHIQSKSIFKNGTQTLELIANCLPNLMYLDISGTNLVESEHSLSIYETTSGIPGLECRIDNPLEFLGLYHTKHNICQRNDIPAKIISGHADENQILNAAVSCMGKPELLQDILMDFDTFFWCDQYTEVYSYLDIVLKSLTTYVKDKKIQKNGSGVLNYILKAENIDGQLLLDDVKLKQQIISLILTGMESHKYDKNVLSNGLRNFKALRIPQDVMFELKRFVQILLHIISERDLIELSADAMNLFKLTVLNLSNEQKYELEDSLCIQLMYMNNIEEILH